MATALAVGSASGMAACKALSLTPTETYNKGKAQHSPREIYIECTLNMFYIVLYMLYIECNLC